MKAPVGTVLFREGEPGEVMYLVREGRVGVARRHGSGEEVLAELGPGAILGEMSLLDRKPRSATATVLEDAELGVIDAAAWEKVCSALPAWLSAIVRVVVDRLRETNVRKHREDTEHAVPALLFVLVKPPDAGVSHWRLSEVATHMGIVYGLDAKDTARLLEFLAGRGVLELEPLEGDLRIVCKEPRLLRLAYEVLLDRVLPKPFGENQISAQEVQMLLALLDAAARHVRYMGSKTVVSLPQLQESMSLNVQDQSEFVPLIRLEQGGHIQLIPPSGPGAPITAKHNVAFEDGKVRELLALHRFLEDLGRLDLD